MNSFFRIAPTPRDRTAAAVPLKHRITKVRHKWAWVGLVLIIGAAMVAIVVPIWAMVREEKSGPGGPELDEPLPGGLVELDGSTMMTDLRLLATSAPSLIGEVASILPLDIVPTVVQHKPDTITVTLTSTTTVHVTTKASTTITMYPTNTDSRSKSSHTIPTHFTKTAALSTATNVLSTETAASLMTSAVLSAEVTSPSESIQPADDMDVQMYCRATNRQHNVYTLCTQGHTGMTGMLKPSSPFDTLDSAGISLGASNPFLMAKMAMLGIWNAAATNLPAFSGRLRDTSHRSSENCKEERRCNCSTIENLEKQNRQLKDTLENARELIKLQWELVSEEHNIITEQKMDLEDMAWIWYEYSNQ
ncbi:uncharacterized protein BCR38DRAFT_504641 [Pseudomassariella vexata]|uniref:Uncharacterized protein n=1 Tax=Pseudomassariella vexata TaxID=1141098 RepID=A0A1Y2DCD8_9PEZI|nr:uncharacterized protein BCR38DRAFT_504641 [Pseudomassariella vexata]ORY56933.1 hypothetical protein BCR38DRAFT_504641 [Pseudomassariella vexata]